MSDLEREHDLSEAFDRSHERIAQDEAKADEACSDPTSLFGMVASITKASVTSFQSGYDAGYLDGYRAAGIAIAKQIAGGK